MEAIYQKDKDALAQADKAWILLNPFVAEEENIHFFFKHQDRYYDAFLYSLESEYLSNIYQDAFELLLEVQPDATEERVEANEQLQQLLDQYLTELSKDSDYEVREFVEEEPDEQDPSVYHLDVCLNVPEVSEETVATFIRQFTTDSLQLDTTFYRFEV